MMMMTPGQPVQMKLSPTSASQTRLQAKASLSISIISINIIITIVIILIILIMTNIIVNIIIIIKKANRKLWYHCQPVSTLWQNGKLGKVSSQENFDTMRGHQAGRIHI